MLNTRYRIPLQPISPNIITNSAQLQQKRNSSADGEKKGDLSSLFRSSPNAGTISERQQPSSSTVDLNQGYARQNSALARNIAYLSRQIQNLQQENSSLRHRLSLFENISHSHQRKMRQGETALENVRVIRNELCELLAHLEESKRHVQTDSD